MTSFCPVRFATDEYRSQTPSFSSFSLSKRKFMDSSSIWWLSEMGLDSPVFTAPFESMDDELAAILGQDSSSNSTQLVNIPSTNSITSLCTFPVSSEPLPKLQNPNAFPGLWNPNSSAPIILSFESANSPQRAGLLNAVHEEPSKAEGRSKRAPSQTYDHIVAERKRREQLRQQFVALSAIVPGLKKTDKTSLLGDAIKYLKYLQDRVNILEEQATMESVVVVRKSVASRSRDEQYPLPEIQGRVCHKHILIRVHSQNQKGLLPNLIDNLEKLNLAIVNTHVALFGKLTLEITITAEMENEFKLTLNEVARRLRAALD